MGGGDGGSNPGKRSRADADEDLVGRGWGGKIFLQRGDEGRGDGAVQRARLEDGLVLGPEPSDGGGGGFENEAEHGIVSGQEGKCAKQNSGFLGGFRFGVNRDGFTIGAVVEFGATASNQTYVERAVLKFELGKNGDAAGVIGHPYFHPTLMAGRGAVGLPKYLDQGEGRAFVDGERSNLGTGDLGKKRFFVFEHLPSDGAALLPWVRTNVVQHRAEILIRAFENIEVFLGSSRGRKEASEANRVVGQSATVADVAAFLAVLNVLRRPPRMKLGEGGDAGANREESFDGSAGAEEKFEPFDALPLRFLSGGEGGLGGIDGSPLDQVGEFFPFGPRKGGRGLGLDQGREKKKKAKRSEQTHF